MESHDKYADKKNFNFTLLADPDKKVAREYDAVKLGGLTNRRTVYVIDPDGIIIFAEEGMPADQKMIDVIEQHKTVGHVGG